ncbi:helix-turn-helix domain-containing protein [Streptomyces sp. NPDC049099]|uniref:nSTAND1 domain-containing NTPase n=1 Tax=Streptomyces sp. NPDC049099 TaxID=3155768 RepID=UPI003415DB8D
MDREELAFGEELRRWRTERGLSLTALAGIIHYSRGHISRVERGEKPATEEFARMCDQALMADGELLALAVRAVAAKCPYPGLTSFSVEDARWFFGRDRAVAELLGLIAAPDSSGHPAVVIGPSGIGKSSLLRAGLAAAVAGGALPARQPGTPGVLYMTPTARPVEELHGQDEWRELASYA